MSIEPAVATVSVIDPHHSDRQSLEPLITRGGWRPLFFASAAEFLAAPRAPAPGCLILDLHLPGTGELLVQRRELSIVFATDRIDIPATVRAMKAGAIDVLTRPLHEEDVSNTIAAAIDHNRQRMRHQSQLEQLRARYNTLSSREREVMALVVSGLMNKHASDRLSISVVTVKAHRGQAMRKMAAHSLAQLVHMANELNIEYPAVNVRIGLQAVRSGALHPPKLRHTLGRISDENQRPAIRVVDACGCDQFQRSDCIRGRGSSPTDAASGASS